ncbi:putative reverse transcriptase domain-containing protein [Tanacetum coccineum]
MAAPQLETHAHSPKGLYVIRNGGGFWLHREYRPYPIYTMTRGMPPSDISIIIGSPEGSAGLRVSVNGSVVIMSSATSAPVAPPSPDYILGPEDPQTPPVPQDEDEREPMFPLPPVDSPTAESPGYVTESDPEEDPEEYEDDETEDGPVDYPMDGEDDGDDDDGDSSRDDADGEDEDDEDEEEEEEHLAPADSAIVVPVDELFLWIYSENYKSFKAHLDPVNKDLQVVSENLGAGYSFQRKPCFVCGSLSHLIKNCDYYEKKMAREATFQSKRVVHTDVRQATPAWTNSNRVNKANQFTPRPVQLNNIRPNFSTASRTIKTGRVNVNSGKQHVSSGSLHVSSGTHIKSGTSSFNTGKQHVVLNGQEEGIDYDEVFAPVARIEAIRLFLAFASFMGFIVYQMDVKQTKLTMGNAIVKLVKKVKKLEGFMKRKNLVLTDSEEEEPEAQGRKSQDDPQDSSVQGLVTPPTTKV